MTEQNENVVEEVVDTTEESTEQQVEEVAEEKVDESKFKSAGDDSVIKIDLSKPPPNQESEEVEQDEEPAKEETVDVVEEPEIKEEVVEENDETPAIEEVVDEQVEVEEEQEVVEPKKQLSDKLQKLMDFMEETGGDIQDYVNLNRDVSKMDNSDILDEYYKVKKSHLTAEERSFLLEDTFGFDEDEDDPKEIRKKKIALKEQVAEAKAYLDGQKSKYYEDIKAGSKLTPEQQKAIEFFNRYNKESENQKKVSEANRKVFNDKTNNLFNDKFKGFEYNVGDKKYRINVKDVNKVKESQSNINNFTNKFLDQKTGQVKDAASYHKSLYTAMNADAIANHFYEQGKADAIKGQIAKGKNINTNPRQTHNEINVGGVKYRVMGDSSSDIKNRSFKVRKKN
tara:strand:+ start:2208 stop:3398 length:1191 start_codon:yes stop_codon:yes gene_type:complete